MEDMYNQTFQCVVCEDDIPMLYGKYSYYTCKNCPIRNMRLCDSCFKKMDKDSVEAVKCPLCRGQLESPQFRSTIVADCIEVLFNKIRDNAHVLTRSHCDCDESIIEFNRKLLYANIDQVESDITNLLHLVKDVKDWVRKSKSEPDNITKRVAKLLGE